MSPDWVTYRVGQVLIVDNSKVLLVANRWYKDGPPVWSLPGGRANQGESVLEAARREASEETGLEVTLGDLAYVAEARSTTFRRLYIACAFVATQFGGSLRLRGDDAVEAVEWVPADELERYLRSPSIRVPVVEFLRTRTVRYWYFPEYWEAYLQSLAQQ
jgi:8-oxo-dGTP diphosphatase